MMKKTVLCFSLLSLILLGCSKPENKPTQTKAAEPAELTASQNAPAELSSPPIESNNGMRFKGDYEGVFPCADCEGLKTELELKSDFSYELSEEYLGKGKGHEFKVKGTFHQDANDPNLIQLDQAGNKRKFLLVNNTLEARDADSGAAMSGPLAQHYILTKQAD